MRVVDGTGAKEEYPAVAEAVIKLKECTVGMDSFEVDNIATTAKSIPTNTDRQTRTFCGQNDEDWVKFSLAAR